MADLCAAALSGNAQTAAEIQQRLLPLHRDLFIEANPIPVKWAAARMGLCQGHLRLPLTPFSQAHHAKLEASMRVCGLI